MKSTTLKRLSRNAIASTLLAIALAAPSFSTADEIRRTEDPARREAIRAAQGEMEKAQGNLRTAEERVRASWRAEPLVIAAEREFADANAALTTTVKPVLDRLRQTAEYQSLVRQEGDASINVAEVTRESAPLDTPPMASTTQPSSVVVQDVPREMVQAAEQKLAVRSKRREMETAAIGADPLASAAQARVTEASTQLATLQAQFDATLSNDPEYKAAREQVAAAKARIASASAGN